jgi:translation elongation factor EF-Tu-like GTPase
MPVEDVFTITGRGTVATGRNRNWYMEMQLKSLVWELKN